MTAAHQVQQIRLSPAAHAVILRECAASADGTETGGILLGRLHTTVAEVHAAGDPGPAAVRQPTFFLRDLGHAQHLAHDAFARDGSVWIGEWHTHLAAPPTPSRRDLTTYARLLADPELGFEVIIAIITAASPQWAQPTLHAWACYTDHFEHLPLTLDTAPVRTPTEER